MSSFSPSSSAQRPWPSPRVGAATSADLSLCVLGSGSGGNCTIVRHVGQAIFIDAGIGPRTIRARLASAQVGLDQIVAICLTHLDQDHFRTAWVSTILRLRLVVYVHRWHVGDLERLPGGSRLRKAGLVEVFGDEPFEPLPGLRFRPIRLAHDRKGTCGFRVEAETAHIGYATDLGHVPAQLIEHFLEVDLLAIESNYDPDLQRGSGRPLALQRRIMGKAGHLSNQQAFDAVRQIFDRSGGDQPRHVVLLHRSAQCNRPHLVREMFAQDPRLMDRLILSEPRRRTTWLELGPDAALTGKQMYLFTGQAGGFS